MDLLNVAEEANVSIFTVKKVLKEAKDLEHQKILNQKLEAKWVTE